MATLLATDLKDPGLYEAGVPWDLFAHLRREDPVHWTPESDGAGFWSVMRHADIVEVSRQPQLFSSAYENGGHRIFNENEVGLTGAGESAIGIPFISRDPPIHTRYRKFVMPALSPPGLATSKRASGRVSHSWSRTSRSARRSIWCRPSPLRCR
jgi:linalool 8-monooxygenase